MTEALLLRTTDGLRLSGWRRAARGTPRAGVVLVHGFVGRGRSPKMEAHAAALAERGFDVIVYDARGHGNSEGLSTLGVHERHDVAAAVAIAGDRGGRVVLVGESMGGTAVLGHAAAADDVHAAVVVGTPANWRMKYNLPTVGAALLTRTPPGRRAAERWLEVDIHPQLVRPETPTDLAARLRVPLAVLHGAQDRFIPVREARTLHARSGGPRRLWIVDGMGHGLCRESVGPVLDAVEWALEPDVLATASYRRAS